MNNIVKLAAFLVPSFALAQPFTGVSLSDSTVSLLNGTTAITTGTTEARWGTWNSLSSTFTPFYGNAYVAENDGYAGDPFGAFELFVTLSAGDNNTIATSLAMALSVSLRDYQTPYAATTTEAILIDPSWVTAAFSLSAESSKEVFFTTNTTAVKGAFTFGASGNDVINLVTPSAVPEPSSFAAIAGLGILGFAASRRRRVA